eukprot:TRINITY_DN10172_c0_g1_i2.p1 TRINITY_DN10172_c0_g1~~TRINITY_DN10172_c0_g1_i2.p1  ORF type:complete len:249 (-),score=16.21 TRINITY_DN10172_c0_g1_i2:168-914(-)
MCIRDSPQGVYSTLLSYSPSMRDSLLLYKDYQTAQKRIGHGRRFSLVLLGILALLAILYVVFFLSIRHEKSPMETFFIYLWEGAFAMALLFGIYCVYYEYLGGIKILLCILILLIVWLIAVNVDVAKPIINNQSFEAYRALFVGLSVITLLLTSLLIFVLKSYILKYDQEFKKSVYKEATHDKLLYDNILSSVVESDKSGDQRYFQINQLDSASSDLSNNLRRGNTPSQNYCADFVMFVFSLFEQMSQ